MPGTNGESIGTGGASAVTSGGQARRQRRVALAAMLALGIIQSAANGVSRLDDLRSAGGAVNGLHIALDEGTSIIAWFILMFGIWRLVAVARPPRLSWPATLAVHAALTVPVSLAHVGLFVILRHLSYAAIGDSYPFTSDWGASLLYEYRKDAASYALLALAMAGIQHFFREPAPAEAPEADGGALAVGDGKRTHYVPIAEIDWIEASGNYVTLHGQGQALLHRATLAAMEADLRPHGFARIHRSRLVRRAAVRKLETGQSGDFEITLADGTALRGSRRYREALSRN